MNKNIPEISSFPYGMNCLCIPFVVEERSYDLFTRCPRIDGQRRTTDIAATIRRKYFESILLKYMIKDHCRQGKQKRAAHS